MRSADAVSLKGLQKDGDGQLLSKRKSENDDSHKNKQYTSSSSEKNMSIVFNNCAKVHYNVDTKEYEIL